MTAAAAVRLTNELGEPLSERMRHPTPYDRGLLDGEHGRLMRLRR